MSNRLCSGRGGGVGLETFVGSGTEGRITPRSTLDEADSFNGADSVS